MNRNTNFNDEDFAKREAKIDSSNDEQQLVNGSAWLTFGNLFSRILGALYIIPWTIIIGRYSIQANGLFNMGYTIYAMFLMIATAGIPTAISNLVAHYNAINQGRISLRLLWEGIRIGFVTGLLSAIVLFIFSPLLAAGHHSLVPVLWSLTPAVFVFPILSMLRGFFQGNQMMKQSAVSQIVEQIVRILYLLIGTWLVLRSDPDNWQGAVVQSTFAAFIGALAGLFYLVYSYSSSRKRFVKEAKKQSAASARKVDVRDLILGIFKQAVPFIIVASAVTFYQWIDQYTFFPIMNHFTDFTDNQLIVQFSRFNANANKLVMIIVPIASSIAATSLPMLSSAFANHDHASIKKQIANVYRLFLLSMIVTAFGLYAVALPIYMVFYGNTDPSLATGVQLLQISAIVSIFYGSFSVLSFVIQGLGDPQTAMRSLFYGMFLKIIFQVPAVFLFQSVGAMISTFIGFAFSSWYLSDAIKKRYQIGIFDIGSDLIKIFLLSILVMLFSWLIVQVMEMFVPLSRFYQIFVLIVSVSGGGALGIYLIFKWKVANDLVKRFIPRRFRKEGEN